MTKTLPARPRARTGYAIAGLAIGMLLSTLDQTIVATALPALAGDLGDLSSATWVVGAYLLTTTATAPLYGKLRDLYGRRRMVLIAMSVFVAASVLAGLAPDMGVLIALRAVQGLGGGGLVGLGSAGIADLVPLHERGKALSYSGAVFAAGSIGGPLLGGLFTDHLDWRWVFYINVPIGLVALLLVAKFFAVPHTSVRGAVDVSGSILLVGAVTAVMLVMIWGGRDHAWDSPQILGLLAVAVVLLAAFILRERRAANPVLPLRLFRVRAFAVAVPASIVLGMLLLGAVVFLPQYFQAVRGMTASMSGLALTPLMLGVVGTMTVVGGRVSATGRYRAFPIVGAVLALAGFAALSQLDAHTPAWQVALAMLILGMGIGFAIQLLVLIMQNSAEPQFLGVASAAAMFFRSMGGALGTALFSTILLRRLTDEIERQAPALPGPANEIARHVVADATVLPQPARAIVSGAFAESIHVVYLWALPFAGLLLVLALLLPSVPLWTVEFLRKLKADHESQVDTTRN